MVCAMTPADVASLVVLAVVTLWSVPLIVLDGLRIIRHYRKRR